MLKKKASVICLSILLMAIMVTGAKAAKLKGSGPTMYASFEGYMTYSRKDIFSGATSFTAYNSSSGATTFGKIGFSIASAYFVCPSGPGSQVTKYNWVINNASDYYIGYATISFRDSCSDTLYAGGNHQYTLGYNNHYQWAEHSE